ncbi:MAG: PilN domain-containing protein, partial [bacterium]|nr:PilN domain-containing protein [bacterium]
QMLDKSDAIEYRLNKLKKKLAVYPDHMLYLKTVAESMDEEAVLIGYNIGDGRITLEGYSSDSLAFLSLLRKSGHFKEVKFKTAVTKNAYSKREKFEIDILLLEGGVTPPTQSTAEKPTAEKSTTEKSTTEKITPEKNGSGKPPTKKPAKKSAKKTAKKPDKKPVKKPVKKPGKKPVSKRKPAKGARNG